MFDLHGDAVQALNWYGRLSFQQRQEYIDRLGKYRAQDIQQFTVDVMWFIKEFGNSNGFNEEALVDLWQRVRTKLTQEGVL